MKKHWKYLMYVLRHKWYVMIECFKMGLFWRGLVHDISKFLPLEWTPYTWSFYGPWRYNERPNFLCKKFDYAWLHHQKCNKHHWQYWVLQNDSDGVRELEIPDVYIMEMLADWKGAGRAQGHESPRNDPWKETREWFNGQAGNMKVHPESLLRIEKFLLETGYDWKKKL